MAFSSRHGELYIELGAHSPSLCLPPRAGVVSGVRRYFPGMRLALCESSDESYIHHLAFYSVVCLVVVTRAVVEVAGLEAQYYLS